MEAVAGPQPPTQVHSHAFRGVITPGVGPIVVQVHGFDCEAAARAGPVRDQRWLPLAGSGVLTGQNDANKVTPPFPSCRNRFAGR